MMVRGRFGKIGVALVILGALGILGCTQSPEAKSAKFIEAGKKLLQKNDPTSAKLQFLNAVRATPNNAEAFYQLGVACIGAGELSNGFSALRKALELDPKHAAAQLRLSQLMTTASDPETLKDAQQRLEALLEETPENADALHALALTEWKLGEPGDAIQHLEQAVAAAPKELILAESLAQAKLQQKDIKGAEEVLKQACARLPNSAAAATTMGAFYTLLKRFGEAEQEYQRALTLEPNNGLALMDLSMLQYRTGRPKDAEQGFKRVSGLPEKKYKPAYGMFLWQQGRRDEAIREFEKLAKNEPNDRAARTRLVSAYQAAGKLQDAQNVLSTALNKNPKDLDALLKRGELLMGAGKYLEAQADLKEVVRQNSTAPEPHYVLAKLSQARDETRIYRQELSEALRLNGRLLKVRLELSEAMIKAKDGNGAVRLLDEAPNYQKTSIVWIAERNWALWASGDTAELRKGVDRGLSIANTPDFQVQDGLLKGRTGDVAGARKSMEAALAMNPGDLHALESLYLTYEAKGEEKIGREKISEYVARAPASAEAQEFLGNLQMTHGHRDLARTAFNAAKGADPRFIKAELSLAQLDVAELKLDDADARLQSILSRGGNGSSIAHLWLSIIEQNRGHRDLALQHLRKSVELDANNAEALNNLAYLLADYGNQPDEALKYAQKAKELAPGNADCGDTLGWVLYKKGLYSMAVKELAGADAIKKRDPLVKYHLAMAYKQAGNEVSGRNTLAAALKLNSALPEAKMATELIGSTK